MSAIAPLSGPGLFNVSVMPRFLLNSRRVGWRGAYFTEIDGAATGVVDHGHERYCIQRGMHVEGRRALSGGSWRDVPTGFEIWQAGDEQRYRWRRGGHSQFLFVAPEVARNVLGFEPLRLPATRREPLRSRTLELIFDALQSDLVQRSPAGPLVGESLIAALLAHLAGRCEDNPRSLDAPARDRALDLIEARFTERLSLAELAAAAGVGARQFCRSFRAAMGVSPHRYLLRRRVDHGKFLIAKGLALADAALQSGFTDQSQFTRAFMRCVGTTPGRYRQQLRR